MEDTVLSQIDGDSGWRTEEATCALSCLRRQGDDVSGVPLPQCQRLTYLWKLTDSQCDHSNFFDTSILRMSSSVKSSAIEVQSAAIVSSSVGSPPPEALTSTSS